MKSGKNGTPANDMPPQAAETELDILLKIDLVDTVKFLRNKLRRYPETICFVMLLCPAGEGSRQVQLASNLGLEEIGAVLAESFTDMHQQALRERCGEHIVE